MTNLQSTAVEYKVLQFYIELHNADTSAFKP